MNVNPMILELNTANVSPGQNTQKLNNKPNDDSFSSVLSKTQDQKESQKDGKTSAKANTDKTDSPKELKAEETQSKSSTTKETKDLKDISNTSEDILEEISESEKLVLDEIASLLQITPEKLQDLLETLKIGLSDLLQKDNLQNLLMQVNGVDDPMDLLLIPEIASQMKAITSILEEFAEQNSFANTNTQFQLNQPATKELSENVINIGVRDTANMQVATKEDLNIKDPDKQIKSLNLDYQNPEQISIVAETDESLLQNEEDLGFNQNSSATQFLETLSGAVGEAFKTHQEAALAGQETRLGANEIVDPRIILDQVVEKIKVISIEKETQMNIQLKPEHLGKLSMEVVSKQGIMTAQFTVENEKTKQILEQNIANLKETLESKGLVIEQLEVTVGQNEQDHGMAYTGSGPNKNISNIINRLMNEEEMIEEDQIEKPNANTTSEVDFIA